MQQQTPPSICVVVRGVWMREIACNHTFDEESTQQLFSTSFSPLRRSSTNAHSREGPRIAWPTTIRWQMK